MTSCAVSWWTGGSAAGGPTDSRRRNQQRNLFRSPAVRLNAAPSTLKVSIPLLSSALLWSLQLLSPGVATCWVWRSIGAKFVSDPPLAELVTNEDGTQSLRTLRDTPSSQAGYDLDEEEEPQVPQAIESQLSPIQFKQLSVGKTFSCGIQYLDGKIRCWGTLKGVLKGTDLIESDAPYRQVSVGDHGVCMIAEGTNAATCLGASGLPSNEWDQLKVGKFHVCGVTMDSELKCSGPAHAIINSLRDDFVVA